MGKVEGANLTTDFATGQEVMPDLGMMREGVRGRGSRIVFGHVYHVPDQN